MRQGVGVWLGLQLPQCGPVAAHFGENISFHGLNAPVVGLAVLQQFQAAQGPFQQPGLALVCRKKRQNDRGLAAGIRFQRGHRFFMFPQQRVKAAHFYRLQEGLVRVVRFSARIGGQRFLDFLVRTKFIKKDLGRTVCAAGISAQFIPEAPRLDHLAKPEPANGQQVHGFVVPADFERFLQIRSGLFPFLQEQIGPSNRFENQGVIGPVLQ